MNASELFDLIARVAIAEGAAPLNKRIGCWEWELGEWSIAVNGHNAPTKTSDGVEVPAFNAYVAHGDLPCGFVDPFGGVMLAGAENDLIADLKQWLATHQAASR
jgi:hypothetical protein